MKGNLIEICKNYILEEGLAVISEPYIPFIPDNWNGILILAESQNLSKGNQKYVDALKKMLPNEKFLRLYKNSNNIGVYPWDDGSLKLAIESSLEVKSYETAISNAVLWSQRSQTGANINPNERIIKYSEGIWKEFLEILDPKIVIVTGKIAKDIIYRTRWKGEIKELRLPAKTAMSRMSGMFDENDLLTRFPEVKQVVERNKGWVKDYSLNKIFYACHAVSVLTSKNRKK